MGSMYTAQVFIGDSNAYATCKTEIQGISLPAAYNPIPCASGKLGGKVWNDTNGDGVRDVFETAYCC